MSNARIKFLQEASEKLVPSTHAKKLLRSYYQSIANKLFHNKDVEKKNECPKCFTNWIEGDYELSIESNKIPQKGRRMVADLESGKSMTRKQKMRAKFFKKKQFSCLIFKCNLCTKITKIPLEKPTLKDKLKDSSTTITSNQSTNKVSNVNKSLSKKDNSTSSKSNKTTTSAAPVQTTKKPAPNSIQMNSQKNNKPKKKPNNSKNKNKNVQIVSKTQEKNTLQKLALLLKQQKSDNNKPNDNRLKNLLR